MEPPELKSAVHPFGSGIVYLHTSEDGTVLMVERATSSTTSAHRFTVHLDRGIASENQRAYLDTLYRTFCGIPGPPR
jgi:hypothetical protein